MTRGHKGNRRRMCRIHGQAVWRRIWRQYIRKGEATWDGWYTR